jgi:FSR family fosmidomycin resistance protein-like MFS transporter
MRKFGTNALFLISTGHSYNDIFWLFLPLVLPILRTEFHLSYTQSGLLLSFYTFIIAVFSFLNGHLGDLYGRGRILSLGFLLTAMSYISLVFLKSFHSMLVVLTVAGIGVSTFHSLAPPLLSEQFRQRKGILFGIFEGAGSAGILLMMCFFGMLVNSIGWRPISALIALVGLPLAFAFYKKDPPASSSQSERAQKVRPSQTNMVVFFLSRALRALGIVAIVSFVPLFVVDILSLSIQRAAFFSGMIFLGGAVGALITGWLSESYHPLSVIALLHLVLMPIVLLVTLPSSLLLMALFLVGLGICYIGFFPPQDLWLSQVSRRAMRGKIFGAGMTLDTIAAAIAPGLFGFIGDRWDLVTSFRWMLLPLGSTLTVVK